MSAAAAPVTLVTGAGGGIGVAVARRLAGAGHRLALLEHDARRLRAVTDELRADGAAVLAVPADVADGCAVERAVGRAEDELGPLTGLANVAGVLTPGRVLDEGAVEGWHRMLAVNATGVLVVSRAVAARMAPRRDGAIVTVASNAAGVPRAGMAAYAASKAAARSLTHSLGLELGPLGIRCNVVAPGSTETPMLHALWDSADGADGADGGDSSDSTGGGPREATLRGDPDAFRAGIPLGRVAEPDDVAGSVAFLLSERARHVHLATLAVDGGAALGAI